MRNHPFLSTIKVGKLIKEEPFVFIDLTRPQEELAAAITRQHRRCIRKAQQSGLSVMYSDKVKYLKVFYEFYRMRQQQKGVGPKDFMFFDQMFRLLRGHLTFSIAQEAKKILAVSLLLKDSGDVFMTYGGMSDEGYERYAKHLMIYDMMSKFKSKRFSRLVLGTGNNGKDSIYDFKKGFTDRECSVCTYGIQ
jgi:lipid II:glycine glycyltransferase (peptidoglycan interpeptide bridge formation enzyme)